MGSPYGRGSKHHGAERLCVDAEAEPGAQVAALGVEGIAG